jgi:hypothetical protein
VERRRRIRLVGRKRRQVWSEGELGDERVHSFAGSGAHKQTQEAPLPCIVITTALTGWCMIAVQMDSVRVGVSEW